MSKFKRIPRRAETLIALFVVLTAAGCFTPYSKQALPMRLHDEKQARAAGLKIGKRAEISRSGFRLFTWPLDMPSAIDAVEDLITQYQAVGVANLEVDFHEWTILQIVSFPRVTVSGNLVLPRVPPEREE